MLGSTCWGQGRAVISAAGGGAGSRQPPKLDWTGLAWTGFHVLPTAPLCLPLSLSPSVCVHPATYL